MAMSKALRARQYWAEIDISNGTRYVSHPNWLSRKRKLENSEPNKTDDDIQTTGRQHSPDTPQGQLISLTLHARHRMAQRNLSTEEIESVLLYAQTWHKAGAVIWYLRRKDLPTIARSNQRWQQLVGTTIVMNENERTILTAYRNRDSGLHHIKCKPNFGW